MTKARGKDAGAEKTAPKTPPEPQSEEKLIARGTLMAVLHAEIGSYAAVAELFGVKQATVRWWVHETRKRRKEDLQKIADRLRGDVAQLAVDRIMEGLVEGETEFAAVLGSKILHGLGDLKAHSAVKNETPPGGHTLTLIVEHPPLGAAQSAVPAEIIEGSVLGVARQLGAPQTAAVEADAE